MNISMSLSRSHDTDSFSLPHVIRIAPKKQFVVHLVFLSSYLSDGLPIGLSYKCRIEYIPIRTYMQLSDTHTPTDTTYITHLLLINTGIQVGIYMSDIN